MTGPTVSVCVITYNQRRYLAQCLESIVSQRGDFSMEVIVADDCSTDGAHEVAEDFARRDERIRLLRPEHNLGMGGNVKAALNACSGEFIALCEGDDFWTDPLKLSGQLAVFDNPEVTLSLTGGVKVDEAGQELGPFSRINKTGPLTASEILASGGGRWPTCSTVFRRECLSGVPEGIYEQPVIDWPLHVFLATQGQAWCDPMPTCAWRMASRGSWTENLQRVDQFVRLHQMHRDLEDFFLRELGPDYAVAIRRGFARHILYFYAAGRTPIRLKWRELSGDLPRLDRKQRAAAIIFSLIPGLGDLALSLRRRTALNSTN